MSKDITGVAGRPDKKNIATLGPLVLPLIEKLLFFSLPIIVKKHLKDKMINVPEKNLGLAPIDVEAINDT